jgi:polyhydroxybutyrate depolymerase
VNVHANTATMLVALTLGCSQSSESPVLPPAAQEDASGSHESGGTSSLPDATSDEAPSVNPPADAAGAESSAGNDGARVEPDASMPPETDKSSGCGSSASLPDGEATIEAGGLTRRYVLRKPVNYAPDRPWPLVLALHPNGGSPNPAYWDTESGPRALAPLLRDKAIALFAAAREGDWRGDLPSDLAYFDAVIEHLENALCIDKSRIFAMGFSGGGSFSGVLGCSREDIRAIGAGGAVIYFDPNACVGRPAAWITIGEEEFIDDRRAYRDFWRARNGCSEASTPVEPAGCIAYNCPDPTRPVHFCSHAGGHLWPDFGTQAVWDFFSRF